MLISTPDLNKSHQLTAGVGGSTISVGGSGTGVIVARCAAVGIIADRRLLCSLLGSRLLCWCGCISDIDIGEAELLGKVPCGTQHGATSWETGASISTTNELEGSATFEAHGSLIDIALGGLAARQTD